MGKTDLQHIGLLAGNNFDRLYSPENIHRGFSDVLLFPNIGFIRLLSTSAHSLYN